MKQSIYKVQDVQLEKVTFSENVIPTQNIEEKSFSQVLRIFHSKPAEDFYRLTEQLNHFRQNQILQPMIWD